jgi:hypothetical protein
MELAGQAERSDWFAFREDFVMEHPPARRDRSGRKRQSSP